jgi:hypothetical protein
VEDRGRRSRSYGDEDVIWFNIKKKKPKCDKTPDSFGTSVLVYESGGVKQAFYGCRVTDKPGFYLHGASLSVEWWMPMPDVPGEDGLVTAPLPWRVGHKQANNIYDSAENQIGVFFEGGWAKRAVAAINAMSAIRAELELRDDLERCGGLKRMILKILDGS